MLGWKSVLARDFDELVVNGWVDDDLEGLKGSIERRILIRDGVRECPDCGELMNLQRIHIHNGMVYMSENTYNNHINKDAN